jgi:acyl-coenzyme A synthetase/AMP-(fatty) acid ligase
MTNETPTLAELVAKALARPASQLAVQFQRQWYDWDWMRRCADRVNALLDEAGVGPQDAIAIAPANRPACAAALLGLIARSRDIVMIYAYQSPEAIGRKIRDLKCAAVLAQAEAWEAPALQAALDTGALAISLGEDAQHAAPNTRIDRSLDHRTVVDEPGLHLLTSGTTGAPKLRRLSYEFIMRSMVLESPMHPYGAQPPSTPSPHTAAFGNIAGLYSWLPHVASGRPVIMYEKFNLSQWLEYVREYRPASSGMPPAAFRQMMDENIPPEALAGIRYMSAGASALDADLQMAVEAKYGVKILHAYGATEFGGVIATVRPEHIEQYGPEKSLSVGRPWAGAEFRIVDPETGEELPPGTGGELHVRVPRVGPDWIRTSDLAKLDGDGFLYYLGRSDGAIVRGGFKIDPEAVRAALLAHPAVFDALVAGAPDRRLGEVPVAAYVVRNGAPPPTLDDLKAHMRGRLPATFLPVAYFALAALPFTPTNKPNLAAVRDLYLARAEPAAARS